MQTSSQTAAIEEPLLTARRIFSLIAPELALVEDEFERQARVQRSFYGIAAALGEPISRARTHAALAQDLEHLAHGVIERRMPQIGRHVGQRPEHECALVQEQVPREERWQLLRR